MADQTPSSVVIVLNFRRREDTLGCVASLVDGNPAHDVLVVDNGSFDGTIETVAELWPHVSTLQTGRNLGFSGGMNAGLAWALSHSYDVATVLNNDTVVEAGALDRLAGVTGDRPVAASPRIVYRNAPDVAWFEGGVLDPADGLPRHMSRDEAAGVGAHHGVRDVDLLAGCCITASAATWRAVGTFDDRYFLNFEDSDWSMRARAAGVALVVVEGTEILHSVSASFVGQYSYLSTYFYVRNMLLFARTWLPRRQRWLLLRRHALPIPVRSRRSDGWREACRQAVVTCWAIASHLFRRYGPAPRGLGGLAQRWAGEGRAEPPR
jgi:hypothetical protein